MNKLIELGFEQVGYTSFENGQLKITISRYELAKNILYAFVHEIGEDEIDWQVVYIGHSRNSLKNRMTGYRLGNGQATNNRVHNHLNWALENDTRHYVYVLHDKINLNVHSIEVDLAAGLEYSLIQFYANYNAANNHSKLFNIAGIPKNTQNQNIEDILCDIREEIIDYIKEDNQAGAVVQYFEYKLDKTNWNNPIVNIPLKFQERFGQHGDFVSVDFFNEKKLVHQLEVIINRNAVSNSAPRLHFPMKNGVNYFQDWKHQYFKKGDTLTVSIMGRNHLSFNL